MHDREQLAAFAAAVKARREERQLTVPGLAQILGWNRQKVYHIEKGDRAPNPEDAARLAATLGVLPAIDRPERPAADPPHIDTTKRIQLAKLLLTMFFPGRNANAWPHLNWQADQIIDLLRRIDAEETV